MPGEEGPPSDEVLASLRRDLADALGALEQTRAELAQARQRIAELEARLRHTPRNPSRPPSSEGLGKPPPRRSLRKKSGRGPGGQDGHKGTTLAQIARPDREMRHEPGRCGHRTKGTVPAGAEAPVQYGPRIAAVIVCLYTGQFLSKKRTAQALAELFGIPLSSGTVAALTARAAQKLDRFLEQVRQGIAASEVAGFDETGFRVEGRLHWVHCARTGRYMLLMVHPKRGKQAIEAMGVLPAFAGIAVHDAWAPYDGYAGAEHQLCRAHALRELQAVAGTVPAGQWCWAAQAAEALAAMQDLAREAISQGRGAIDPAALAARIRLFRSAVLTGISKTAARSAALMKSKAFAISKCPVLESGW